MSDQSDSGRRSAWGGGEARRSGSAGGGDSSPQRAGSGAGGQPRQAEKPSAWEWVTAAAGAVLVLGAIGYMGYDVITVRQDPIPRITVRLDTIAAYDRGYTVEFFVENEGGATAASLLVEGRLHSDTGVVERSETTIDYVPAHSRRRGGLLFTRDPRRYRLDLRPLGYERP